MAASHPNLQREAWRDGLLDKLRFVLFVAWIFACIVILFSSRSSSVTALSIFSLVTMVTVHWVLSRRALSFKLRAWSAIGGMTAVAIPAYVVVGFNPGAVLVVALCVVFSTLLLGEKATRYYLAFVLLTLFALTAAIWTGLWAGPQIAESSVRDPVIWARSTVLSGIVWAGIAYVIFFVVNSVEGMLAHREQTLAQLQQEVAHREAAERGQREAEAIANQSQRLDALGHLAAGVAHDFNNALLVVQGWNEILRDSDSSQLRAQGADAIQQATEQAGQLASQLLTFARQEVRRPRYLLADQVIADTLATLKPLLPAEIGIEIDTEPGCAFFADPTQIQQMLLNLLINARDAMPAGGDILLRNRYVAASEVTVKCDGVDASKDWVVLSVEDQGSGMDDRVREKIFEPFFTTKDIGKGTGLGLSTVFGIVKQGGGHIEVWSEPARGARFTIYFPAVQVAPQGQVQKPVAPLKNTVARRVLVLEDDALAREFIVFALTREGIQVDVAADGDEALELIRDMAEPADVLCTDAVFPGAPLGEVIAAFEAASPHGRVLLCSGYVPEKLAISGLESGFREFLAKPFSASDLVQKIALMLAARDMGNEVATGK